VQPVWNRSDRYIGSALDVTGWYQGHPVRLRVYEGTPDDASIDASIEHRTVISGSEPLLKRV